MSTSRFYIRLLLGSSMLTAALFGWTLWFGEFFSDDFTWMWHGERVAQQWGNLFSARMASFFSPVMNLYFAVFASWAGYLVWVYFFVGLIVHVLVSWLSGVLMMQLSGRRVAAVLTLVLVLVAGTAYEPLVWVASQMHSIVTLWVMASLVSYQRFLYRATWPWALLSFVFVLLALLTKETGVMVGPLLVLLLLVQGIRKKQIPKSLLHYGLGFLVAATTLWYLFAQVAWQGSSVALQSGLWELSFGALAKLPLVLFDLVIPIGLWVQESTALMWSVGAGVVLAASLVAWRKYKLVWFGVAWAVLASLPTLFFVTEHWWSPLASRYTYLPRIGMVIVLVVIVTRLAPRMRRASAIFISVIVIWQVVFWGVRVAQEYPLIYTSGSTLRSSVEQIAKQRSSHIFVASDRPFAANNAHVVAAFATLSPIHEKQITFLQKDIDVSLADNQALLYWDFEQNTYQVGFSP